MLPYRLVYHEGYDLKLGDHVFPSQKYRFIHDRLLRDRFAAEDDFVRPVPATAIAASAGAVTSFTFSRYFTYHATHIAAGHQMWRFVLVSGSSLGLNTLGEYLLHDRVGLQYILARVITSLTVSCGWNYPMLKFFVFSGRPPSHA